MCMDASLQSVLANKSNLHRIVLYLFSIFLWQRSSVLEQRWIMVEKNSTTQKLILLTIMKMHMSDVLSMSRFAKSETMRPMSGRLP